MKLLALALCIALPAWAEDAPKREVLEVKTGNLVDVLGVSHDVAGGAYLPTASLVSTAKELAALRAENEVLKENVGWTAREIVLVAGLVVAVAGAAYGAGRLGR